MSLIATLESVGQRLANKSRTNTILLVLLILVSAGMTYYSHWIIRTDVVFSHFFYIPVALAGFWWGKRGIWVAVVLGVLLVASHRLSRLGLPVTDSVFRSVMFVAAGLVVGLLREQALRSETSLRETRDYLDSLIHHANAPIIVWDREGRVTLFNTAFEYLTGYRSDEVIGKSVGILFGGETKEESLQKIEQTSKGGLWEGMEIPVRCKDEQERILLCNSANIYGADGKTLIATIVQGQDITLRKEAEEALHLEMKTRENHEHVTESMLEQRIRELRAHERIIGAMLGTLDLNERLEIGVREIMTLTGAGKAAVSLVEGDRLVMRKHSGFSETYIAWTGDMALNEISSGEITIGGSGVLHSSSRMEEALKKEGPVSWATIPFKSERGLLGMAVIASENTVFAKRQIDILSGLAASLSLMLEHSALYRVAQERLARLTTLREIDRAISANLSMEHIIEVLLRTVSPHIQVDAVGISLIDWERKRTMLARLHLPGDVDIEGEAFHLSDSLLDQLGVEKKPVIIYDIMSDPRMQNHLDVARRYHLSSYVGVPLMVQDKAIGILHLLTVNPCRFSGEDLEFFATLAGQAGISVQNAWLYEKAQRHAVNMENLAKATSDFSYIGEEEDLAEQMLVAACGVTGVKMGALFWYDKERGILELAAGTGLPEGETTRVRERYAFPVGPGATLLGEAAFTRGAVFVSDVSKENMFEIMSVREGSAYLVPLVYRRQLFGVYAFLSQNLKDFSSEQRSLADTFSAYVSSALENVRLFKETERAYKELRTTQRQLLQVQKMEAIGTLAGGIAHDFNNILSAIIGYAELAREDVPEGSMVQARLQGVLKAGMRARDLVRQILTFSRQTEQERKPVQIIPIVKEALKFLRASLPATIEIHEYIDSDTGIIEADPTQIHQVLMNLCTNAAHAMRDREGVLDVGLTNVDLDAVTARHPGLKAGPYVRLTVSDTGCGISPAVMERIFEPFFTTRERGEGTGMGLSVVHGIVESHGGAIAVDSEPEKGSTFHVYFPRIKAEEALQAEAISFVPTGTERILFVDDEKVLVHMVREMLERLGYQVVARTSAIEALEAFRAQPEQFDLVITDQTMPNMTGEMLAQEIRHIKPNVPIILCTGYSESVKEEKIKVAGINELVLKPILKNEMAAAIRRVLDQEKEKRP